MRSPQLQAAAAAARWLENTKTSPKQTPPAMNSAVHRRLAKQLALLQHPVSMHEYSGDPNYLGQKVNSAYRLHRQR